MLSSDQISRIGGVVSVAGVVLFVVFVVALLLVPVVKQCSPAGICKYATSASGNAKIIVGPGFLALSLMTISAGILLVRLGRRFVGKKTEAGSS